MAAFASAFFLATVLRAQPASVEFADPPHDCLPRPIDPGALLPFDAARHKLPDLLGITLASWTPDEPAADLFTGAADPAGEFLRLELVLMGLMNPPGSVDPLDFRPFQYGDHPVFGFVEIDMDGDPDTGGELDAPQYRYLGNAARFGGLVHPPVHRDRAAHSGAAFDGIFQTHPQVERSGEEFHLALLGTEFGPADITVVIGNTDLRFDSGETWKLRGTFFHRAHGYEPFSFVEGGVVPGEYSPPCDLQFRHDAESDRTHITLVFPLTNVGAGLVRDEPPEPTNHDPTDHASVVEALEDLQLSAFFLPILGTGAPEEALLANWAERDPWQHLNPALWSVNAILGGSFTSPNPDGVFFLWSDIYPNVVMGDVDGSGEFDGRDRQLIALAIAQHDHDDGVPDGVVTILDFATDFSVFDVNHDGRIDPFDLTPFLPDGDADRDGDVDLRDVALFQRCFHEEPSAGGVCRPLDLLPDQTINLADFPAFRARLKGPFAP